MQSYADEFITILPHAPFFLNHVVHINYGGKVYAVLRGIEVAVESDTATERALFLIYAFCMLIGQYWYTKFWLDKEDINNYYDRNSNHVLAKRAGPICITLSAAMFYLLFAILFILAYNAYDTGVALSLAFWNLWCFLNLLLATPLFALS